MIVPLGAGTSFYFCYLGTEFPNVLFSIPDDDWKLDCSDHLVVSLSSKFPPSIRVGNFPASSGSSGKNFPVKIQKKDIREQGFNWERKMGLITPPAVMSGELGLHRASALPMPMAETLCFSLMWQKPSGRFSS